MDNWIAILLLGIACISLSVVVADLTLRLRRIENAFADAVKQLEAA